MDSPIVFAASEMNLLCFQRIRNTFLGHKSSPISRLANKYPILSSNSIFGYTIGNCIINFIWRIFKLKINCDV